MRAPLSCSHGMMIVSASFERVSCACMGRQLEPGAKLERGAHSVRPSLLITGSFRTACGITRQTNGKMTAACIRNRLTRRTNRCIHTVT